MKVSEKLPPVLMREYRDQNELMAVFTRPSPRAAWRWPTSRSSTTTRRCCRRCCAMRCRARSPASTCCSTDRPAPARPSWRRSWRRRPASICSRSNTPTATAIRCQRARPLSLAADRAGVPQGQRAGGAAVRRGGRRLSADLQRGRADHGARRTGRRRRASGSVSGKAWVNQILEIERRADDLGDQPHRADRSGVPAPLRLPPRTEVAAARRARRRWCARRSKAWRCPTASSPS